VPIVRGMLLDARVFCRHVLRGVAHLRRVAERRRSQVVIATLRRVLVMVISIRGFVEVGR
jgi:hypothetical protein